VWDTHPSKVASGERKKLYTFYIDEGSRHLLAESVVAK
jgi:hypothetical protein